MKEEKEINLLWWLIILWLKSILNWIPKRNIDDICRDGWNWQLKNPNGY